jgi:Glycosyltransferase family 87
MQPAGAQAANRSVAVQLWLVGALAPLALMFIGEFGRFDFDSLWVAGKMALSGSADHIYDPETSRSFASGLGLKGEVNFPYPPHALLFILPFAAAPHIPAYIAWNVATALFFWWAARPFLPNGFPQILTVLTPAALTCVDYGQTGLLFGGLWLLAFRGKWPALALLTFKPHLGFLAILSVRDWRPLAKAALLAIVLLGATALIWGPSLWAEFFGHTIDHATELGTAVRKRWLFQGVGPAIGYGMVGWIPFAAAGALLLARNINAFTAATASFLISPYGFHYDMAVASLGFGIVIFRHWNVMPIRYRIPTALGFLSPVIALVGVWWVPPVLIWALWAQTKYTVPGNGNDLTEI